MLRRLKGAALLDGFRGADPVDVEQLAQIICRLSELAADQTQRDQRARRQSPHLRRPPDHRVDALISRPQSLECHGLNATGDR